MEGELSGSFGDPKLSAKVNTRNARFEWKGFALEGLTVDVPGTFSAEGLSVGPGIISADKALIPVEEAQVEVASLNGSVSLDTSRVSVSEFGMKLEDVGELSMGGAYEFD
jgi:autotransporter translocation and assembly factor TamB